MVATYYTTDGSTPTTSSQVYTGPFPVTATSTVRFFSVDQSGHTESVKSQQINVDGAAPSVALTSPADGSSFHRGAKVDLVAAATDPGTAQGSPSGIANVTFYLDGKTKLATDSSGPYQYRWNTASGSRGTHSLTAVATDLAGNSATSTGVTVTLT